MTEEIAHSGAWSIAVIMIVVASWLLYRYLTPQKRRLAKLNGASRASGSARASGAGTHE